MDGISRSRGWDKEILHGVLPKEQLVLSDKLARKFYLTYLYWPYGKDQKQTAARRPHAGCTLIRCIIKIFKLHHHVASHRIQGFLEAFSCLSNIK